MAAVRHFEFKKNSQFLKLLSSASNYAVVHQNYFHQHGMYFCLRHGDLTVFKMAADGDLELSKFAVYVT